MYGCKLTKKGQVRLYLFRENPYYITKACTGTVEFLLVEVMHYKLLIRNLAVYHL